MNTGFDVLSGYFTNLEVLSEYFNSGTAEEEAEILCEVFVESKNFHKIITPPSRAIRLLVGSKGSGKSAIVQYWYNQCLQYNKPAIILKPVDIRVQSCDEKETLQLTQNIYEGIVEQIGIKVGSELSGFLSDGQKMLVENAVSAGMRNPTYMDRTLNVLTNTVKAVTQVDFEKMIPKPADTTMAIVRTLNEIFGSNQSEGFYVLFDDIDQFGNAGSPAYIDKIWCAILALRNLVTKLNNVKVIVTLRSEIWRQIVNGDGNGRDQVDHMRRWVFNLSPSASELASILRKRLDRCQSIVDPNNRSGETRYSVFFEGDSCKLPSSIERRPWETFILKESRDRPRDAVQLISLLAEDAIRFNDKKICDRNVDNIARKYSEERVHDLCKENKDLCPDLEMVIRSFASVSLYTRLHHPEFQLDAETVKTHLLGLPGKGKITIQGKNLQSMNKGDMYILWGLLHRIGFFNPKIDDDNGQEGYRHISYMEDSTLVSSSRWEEMKECTWEIHPCYRSFLLGIVADRKHAEIQRQINISEELKSQNNTLNTETKKNKRKKRRNKK